MVSVTPLKQMSKMDRTHPNDLYYAVDTQQHPLRFLHFAGHTLTTDKNYCWYGTKKQFRELCKIHEWDALSLINRPT